MSDWIAKPVALDDVIALRHRVLRAPAPVETAHFDGDDHPSSHHVAVIAQETILGVGSVIPEPLPGSAADRHLRIRGMAVAPERRGEGIGSAVLDALLAHARAVESHLVWCRARMPALSLYLRAGFEAVSDVYESGDLGPHVTMRWTPSPAPIDCETIIDPTP
jgi:predicted GNAT family N-acyltransferase